MKSKKLALEIKQYLKDFAKLCPGTDEYTSPDAYELKCVQHQLERDFPLKDVRFPWSSFASGGYKGTYKQHEDLLLKIKELLKGSR